MYRQLHCTLALDHSFFISKNEHGLRRPSFCPPLLLASLHRLLLCLSCLALKACVRTASLSSRASSSFAACVACTSAATTMRSSAGLNSSTAPLRVRLHSSSPWCSYLQLVPQLIVPLAALSVTTRAGCHLHCTLHHLRLAGAALHFGADHSGLSN